MPRGETRTQQIVGYFQNEPLAAAETMLDVAKGIINNRRKNGESAADATPRPASRRRKTAAATNGDPTT